MEVLLLLLGIVCLLLGLAGAVLPLPGPPLSFVGMLALEYSGYADFGTTVLVTLGIITAILAVVDYYVPIWGTKKFGGTRWGVYGSALGLLAGFFLGPLGWIVGPFVGAFVAEFLHDQNTGRAGKAAFGSFVGLMAGMAVKILVCLIMLVWSVVEIIKHL
jgi:uncharacterized protein YqgC (DUF456 family)